MTNKEDENKTVLIRKNKFNNLVKQSKKDERKRILKIIDNWWEDENTCSGKPHCVVEDCDLCVNCFNELRKKIINLKIKNHG